MAEVFWGMARATVVLCCAAAASLTGCGPTRLLPTPPGWPREIEGRRLYHTPQALIYAPSASSAGWADRYLQEHVPPIEERFGVTITPGVIFVMQPGDQPMTGVEGWPAWPVKDLMQIWPRVSAPAWFPERKWTCALPTDDFYNAVVDYYQIRVAWRGVIVPTAWPFLLLLPLQRRAYVMESYVKREQALATAAIEFENPDNAELLAKVRDYYDAEYRRACQRYGVND
jgi:hypothetical protein